MTFPDIEAALMQWAKATFSALADEDGGPADLHVGNGTPGPGLELRLPFLVVLRTGGPSTRFNDYPTVSMETFGRNRQEAYDVAEGIRTALRPGLVVGGVVIDDVENRTFARLPWVNESILRWGATYDLSARRRWGGAVT